MDEEGMLCGAPENEIPREGPLPEPLTVASFKMENASPSILGQDSESALSWVPDSQVDKGPRPRPPTLPPNHCPQVHSHKWLGPTKCRGGPHPRCGGHRNPSDLSVTPSWCQTKTLQISVETDLILKDYCNGGGATVLGEGLLQWRRVYSNWRRGLLQ